LTFISLRPLRKTPVADPDGNPFYLQAKHRFFVRRFTVGRFTISWPAAIHARLCTTLSGQLRDVFRHGGIIGGHQRVMPKP
jgi:hypothetical protein